MKIEIKKETYEFLKNLAHELNTQSCRATASPYGYIIQEKVKDYNLHGEGEETELVKDCEASDILSCLQDARDDYEADDKIKEKLEELAERYDATLQQLIADIENPKSKFDWDFIESFADIFGYEVYTYSWKYETATGNGGGNLFLTEKAVTQHIKCNNYRYNEARDYLVYLFRNPEMEQLMSAVKEIAGDIK